MPSKINWIIILQGWAMLWVVIGHSPLSLDNMPFYVEQLHSFAYSFHMSLFILISGYLFWLTRLSPNNDYFGNGVWRGYGAIMKDKFMRLGIPYIFFFFASFSNEDSFP